MAGGNFFHRVIQYVANELIVEGLSNSPKFQRFAVRSSKRMDQIAELAAEKKREIAEQMKKLQSSKD